MTADHPTREERYAAVIEAHCFSGAVGNGFARCSCGEEWFGGIASDHRAHVAAALVAADPAPEVVLDGPSFGDYWLDDPAPAQPDALDTKAVQRIAAAIREHYITQPGAALNDEERRTLLSVTRDEDAIAAVERILAARAAQSVPAPERKDMAWDNLPAPEVSRGVAEVKRASWHHGCTCKIAPQWSLLVEHDPDCPFRKALDRIVRNAELRAWDEGAEAGLASDTGNDLTNPYRALPADDGAECCRERTTAGGCRCGGGS